MKSYLALAALSLGIPALAPSAVAQTVPEHVSIAPYTVLPVVFDEPLSIRTNEPGDTFAVTVTDDNGLLPRHTKLDGHVVRIRWANRFHPASMDLHLDDIRYPNGSIQRIDAVPVPLNAKFIRHAPDGRLVADSQRIPVGVYETGGFIGGLIVGSLVHRPFAGGFLGAVGGLFAGIAANNNPDNDLVAKKGTKVGAMFRSDSAPVVANPENPPSPASGPAVVRIGDRTLQFPPDQMPFWSGQTLMLSLPFMADTLDLAVDQSADGPIHIEKGDFMLRLDQDSDAYTLNGKHGKLPAPVQNRNDITYVPVDILAAIATQNVYVNGTKLPKNAY